MYGWGERRSFRVLEYMDWVGGLVGVIVLRGRMRGRDVGCEDLGGFRVSL